MPPQTSQQIEGDYQKLRTSRPTLAQEQETLNANAGLPARRTALEDVRRNVLNTQRTLRGVSEATTARSRRLGGPVTQAALTRLTSTAQQPLSEQLQRFGESEQFEQAGIAGTQQDVAAKLALMKSGRDEESQDYLRRIEIARQSEAEKRAQEFAMNQTRQQQAIQYAQLQQQKASEEWYRKFMEQQNETTTTNTPGGTGVIGGVYEPGADALQNTIPGQIITGFGQLGQGIVSLGGNLPQSFTGSVARAGNKLFDPLDLIGNIKVEDQYKKFNTSATERDRQRRIEQKQLATFLAQHPEEKGKIRTNQALKDYYQQGGK